MPCRARWSRDPPSPARARDEAQLGQNLGALGWQLSDEQRRRLDAASAVAPPYPYYPYWNGQFAERNPVAVPLG